MKASIICRRVLIGLDKISSTFGAFAAVLIDGSMVPWGSGVFNTCDAFASALKGRTAVTFGRFSTFSSMAATSAANSQPSEREYLRHSTVASIF